MLQSIRSQTVRAAVTAMVACAALTACAGAAQAGVTSPQPRTLRDIQRAFEDMGIEFLFEGPRAVGLRFKKQNVDTAP